MIYALSVYTAEEYIDLVDNTWQANMDTLLEQRRKTLLSSLASITIGYRNNVCTNMFERAIMRWDYRTVGSVRTCVWLHLVD